MEKKRPRERETQKHRDRETERQRDRVKGVEAKLD